MLGKALKQVFAPANKINMVPSWVKTKRISPMKLSPSAAFATNEITVGVPSAYGTA